MKYAVLEMNSSSYMLEGELELRANADIKKFGKNRDAAIDYIAKKIEELKSDLDESSTVDETVKKDAGRIVFYEIQFDYAFDSKEIHRCELIELE